jgi:hypothetical protein
MFLRNNADDIPSWFYELPFLDYALHVHNAQKGKIGFMPEAMAVYRTHPGGMWNSRRAPDNDIKRWRLYSIMSVNLAEEEGRAILLQRHKVGMDLVHFYKNNLWKNGDWFQKELEQKKFPGDEKLLKAFNSLPGIKNYFFNCKNYTKAMARKVIKGS